MPPAPRPDNESQRLATLRSYQLLDTAPEPGFDDLTALAAGVAETPIALVSLVDEHRQWFKSGVGLDACETDRRDAFCAYTILDDAPLLVSDTLADPRFADNPLVTGPPHIRAYAGFPLIVPEGFRLGTLCVIDMKPRAFDEAQITQLQRIARQVVAQMVRHVQVRELQEARDDNARIVRTLRKQKYNLGLQASQNEVTALNAKRAHERLDKIASQVPGVVYQYQLRPDGSSCFPYASDGIREIYDVTPDQVRDDASCVIDRLHPDDVGGVLRSITESAEKLTPWRCEYRYRRADGGFRWLHGQATPQRTDDGGTLWHGFITDVSESLQTQQRLRLALDGAKLGLWDWDIQTGEVYFDQAWYEVIGYAPDAFEANFENWKRIVHPDDFSQVPVELEKHYADPSYRYDVDLRHRLADGGWRWINSVGEVVERDEQGRPKRMIGIHRDVDERHRLHERIVEAGHAAEAANAAKSAFLANMSHEIRTPMTSILGYADLLSQGGLDTQEHLNFAHTIKRNGEHLLELMNDILDLSRIESGKMALETMPMRITDVVEGVTDFIRGPVAAKGLSLLVEVDHQLPATIVSDPTRIRQVLFNLLSNAVKFTERGEVCLRVTSVDEGVIRFEVTDTGIGIAPDQIDTLFEAFSQADVSHSRRFGGSGLGLCISQRLAEALGGRIEVESTPGRGSCFALVLDRVHRTDAIPPKKATPAGDDTEPLRDALRGRRVLLAEDSPDNQRLIGFHLERAGATVEIVENGRAAVQSVEAAVRESRPFDVVLMDVQMPELEGPAAIRQLRDGGYDRPIITLTAHAMAGDREAALSNGSDGYLTKPIDPSALIAACAEAPRQSKAA